MPTKEKEVDLALRVTLLRPPAGVQFCLQGRNAELINQTISTGNDLSFDLNVRAAHDGTNNPRFLGPMTHGTPAERFLYVCSGTYAGHWDSPWSRRAKVPLRGIDWDLIERVQKTPSARLEARFAGTGKDGGPVCASVRHVEWQVTRI